MEAKVAQKKHTDYDIIVVGAGLTGLSTAYHLARKGSCKIAVVSSLKIPTLSSQICSMALAGSLDNFTRISHQWGQEKAEKVWKFYHEAYEFAFSFVEKKKLAHKKGRRIRIVTAMDEKIEIEKACSELKALSFKASYCDNMIGSFPYVKKEITAVQDEGMTGGWIDSGEILKFFREKLKEDKVDFIDAEVKSLNSSQSEVTLELDSGVNIKSEAVVLCCHQGIGKLLPNLSPSLVTYQDESVLLSFENSSSFAPPVGLSFSYFHGYLWGCFLDENRLQLGGARFLRENAGIGSFAAASSEKVKSHLLHEAANLFSCVAHPKIEKSSYGLEIKPSDELPVMGPMFGEERILLATGFSGQGLTLGLYAGRYLAELLLDEKGSEHLRMFWPERFRSL